MCVGLWSCQLLLLPGCPTLAEGHCLYGTDFAFQRHPLEPVPGHRLCDTVCVSFYVNGCSCKCSSQAQPSLSGKYPCNISSRPYSIPGGTLQTAGVTADRAAANRSLLASTDKHGEILTIKYPHHTHEYTQS